MYITVGEWLGQVAPAAATCDKVETKVLSVPFRINVPDFLKLVCCAIGRWMIFRTDEPPGRQAWCFVKKHEEMLLDLHNEMFASKIPCVELDARYCRQRGATVDVALKFKRFLNVACRPSSLCKPGVCDPSLVCPPNPPKPRRHSEDPLARCDEVDGFTRAICHDAKRICAIAEQLRDPASLQKCEEVRAKCKEALGRSRNCRA